MKECKSRIKCKTCGGDHHTLICGKTKDSVTAKKNLAMVDSQNNLFTLSHQELQELDMDLVPEDSIQNPSARVELTDQGA
jgi:Cu/Ag efflux protein CusF